MDVPPKNSLESHPLNLTALFKKDLVALKGFFSEEVLSLVENNIDFLMKDYVAWQRALVAMTKNLGVKYDSIAILFNKKSEIMICKRSSNKKTYPNKITSSAGGHVEQGESYKAAAIRELKEELGIKAFLKDLGRFNVITSKERTIHHLFMGKVNKKVSADPNEIASYYFSPLKTIKSDIALHPRKYAKPFHEAFKCYLKYI